MRHFIIPLALAMVASCAPNGADGPPASAPAADNIASSSETPQATPTQIAEGRQIVELACISCHEDEPGAISPHPEAPNLTTLSDAYPVELLDEAFAEGIMVGHPDMPEFKLQPNQITALIAYLESIQIRRGI